MCAMLPKHIWPGQFVHSSWLLLEHDYFLEDVVQYTQAS